VPIEHPLEIDRHSARGKTMTRFRAGRSALLALGFVVACAKDSSTGDGVLAPDAVVDGAASEAAGPSGNGNGETGPQYIAIRDDCDPNDPAWNATGGCLLRRGNVRFLEFADELDSPLSPTTVVGHQAWRNDPSYLVITEGKTVRVSNEGGRVHTFTRVAEFGGGKVPNPALNKGLLPAPECPTSVDIPPGESIRVSGLARGNHRFECCIHPWMRAIIKVQAK
jgi:hypothetical protein